DRQPKMKLQSHCPSLGCEVAAGVLGEVFACWLAVTWCRSLDGPPAPPHPLAVLSWGWASHEPLCHSKRVLAATRALPHAGCTWARRATAGGVDCDGADLDEARCTQGTA